MADTNYSDNNITGLRRKKRRTKGSVIANIAGTVGMILIILVIATILMLFTPKILGYKTYDVVSGSMEPSIPVGSLVLVRDADPEEIKEGEVIAFESDNEEGVVVTHRVVENNRANGEFTTKGDANKQQDADPVPYSSLVGRVVRHFPGMGTVMVMLSSSDGKLFLLCIVAAGVLLNYLSGRLKDQAEGKYESEKET